jgi:integrase
MAVRKRAWKTSSGEEKTSWVVDYRDQSGKRRLKTFTRKKEADAFLATAAVEVRSGVHTPDSASPTIAQAAENWLQSGRDARLEGSTLEQREQHVRLHILPFLGGIKLSQLTAPRVRSFESELRNAGRSDVMVRKVVTSLSSMVSDAQERGSVQRNVVRELRARRRPGTEKRAADRHNGLIRAGIDIPLPGEVKAIVGALKGHYRPVILTALFTGLRASELRGLDWSNVDFDAGVIHVRERADKRNVIGPPKSLSGYRVVPLTPLVANTLKALRLESGGRGLVFGTRSGRPDYIQNIVKRGWHAAQLAAGVTVLKPVANGEPVAAPKYPGLHAARHFFASWCINTPEAGGLGLPAKAVQVRLGHSTIGVTLDTYGHLFPTPDDSARLAAAEAALLG